MPHRWRLDVNRRQFMTNRPRLASSHCSAGACVTSLRRNGVLLLLFDVLAFSTALEARCEHVRELGCLFVDNSSLSGVH